MIREQAESLANSRVVSKPGFELLTKKEFCRDTWPDIYTSYPEIGAQVEQRSRQIDALEAALSKVPTGMDFEEALECNALGAEDAVELYTKLSELLAGKDYQRIALYLPFEIMLRDDYVPNDETVAHAHKIFQLIYMEAWDKLLGTLDVRANFVDGDVLEMELRDNDLPRVVKAVHLAPILVEKGWLTEQELVLLLQKDTNPVLTSNLSDALTVIRGNSQIGTLEKPPIRTPELTETSIVEYANSLDHYIPPRRRQWLVERYRHNLIDTHARRLAVEILTGEHQLKLDLSGLTSNALDAELLIEAARLVFVQLCEQDPGQSQVWANQVTTTIHDAFNQLADGPKKRAAKFLRHCFTYDAISHESLEGLGISTQEFNNDYLTNSTELLPIADAILEAIREDPLLSTITYNVIALGGSRIKGYGEHDSDDDMSIFIRASDTPLEDRESITDIVNQTFAQLGKEKPTLVWLQEIDGRLSVIDFNETDAYTADQFWTHTLFNTVWVGSDQDIATLQGSLLPQYFYAFDEYGNEIPERKYYLERLEQDSLQYRLMHKGYRRHMPEVGIPHWTHGELLDSHSVFWDSGYRRVASLLFLKTVFLPSIS